MRVGQVRGTSRSWAKNDEKISPQTLLQKVSTGNLILEIYYLSAEKKCPTSFKIRKISNSFSTGHIISKTCKFSSNIHFERTKEGGKRDKKFAELTYSERKQDRMVR